MAVTILNTCGVEDPFLLEAAVGRGDDSKSFDLDVGACDRGSDCSHVVILVHSKFLNVLAAFGSMKKQGSSLATAPLRAALTFLRALLFSQAYLPGLA